MIKTLLLLSIIAFTMQKDVVVKANNFIRLKQYSSVIEMAVGDNLSIDLDSNPITLYSWKQVTAPTASILTSASEVKDGGKFTVDITIGTDGKCGYQSFCYTCIHSGHTQVLLENNRPGINKPVKDIDYTQEINCS